MVNLQDIAHFLAKWAFLPAVFTWSIKRMVEQVIEAYKEDSLWKKYFGIFIIIINLAIYFSVLLYFDSK